MTGTSLSGTAVDRGRGVVVDCRAERAPPALFVHGETGGPGRYASRGVRGAHHTDVHPGCTRLLRLSTRQYI